MREGVAARPPVCIAAAFAAGLLAAVLFVAIAVPLSQSKSSTSSSTSSNGLPLITPPVCDSTPGALNTSCGDGQSTQSSKFSLMSLDASDVKSRFFNDDGGPTDIFQILGAVDERIQGINDRLTTVFGCFNTTAPVAYNMTTWGTNVTMQAQCSELWSGGGGFDQFAVINQTFYLYVRGGDGIVAAIAQMQGSTVLSVDVWLSVGIVNRNGSHAVVQIRATPGNKSFEMTVAGAGVGYCGAQLRSDGLTINVTGSADMGETCVQTDTRCSTAADLTVDATCSTLCNTFTLPALGRRAYSTGDFGASAYPGGLNNRVTLNVTGVDDTFFGPDAPVV